MVELESELRDLRGALIRSCSDGRQSGSGDIPGQVIWTHVILWITRRITDIKPESAPMISSSHSAQSLCDHTLVGGHAVGRHGIDRCAGRAGRVGAALLVSGVCLCTPLRPRAGNRPGHHAQFSAALAAAFPRRSHTHRTRTLPPLSARRAQCVSRRRLARSGRRRKFDRNWCCPRPIWNRAISATTRRRAHPRKPINAALRWKCSLARSSACAAKRARPDTWRCTKRSKRFSATIRKRACTKTLHAS